MSIPNCTFGILLQGNRRRGLLWPTWKILAGISDHVAPNWSTGGIWGTVHLSNHLGGLFAPGARSWWEPSQWLYQCRQHCAGRACLEPGIWPSEHKGSEVNTANDKADLQIKHRASPSLLPSCWTHSCPRASWSRGLRAELLLAAHTFCAFKRFGLSRQGLGETVWADKERLSLPPSVICQEMSLWDAGFCLQSAAMCGPGTHSPQHTHVCTQRAQGLGHSYSGNCDLTRTRASKRGHCCHTRARSILPVLSVGSSSQWEAACVMGLGLSWIGPSLQKFLG